MKRYEVLLCVIAVSVLLPGCRNDSPDPVGSDPPPASDQWPATHDFAKALRLRNRSLGHLENKEWSEARSTLAELTKVAPDSLLAWRNQAICHVLSITASTSPYTRSGPAENARKYEQAVVAAKDALRDYRSFISEGPFFKSDSAAQATENALADLLEGRLLAEDDATSATGVKTAIGLLRKAAESTNRPDYYFAYAMAMDGNNVYADQANPESAELLQALQKSFELAPQNLFVLQKLMQRQALCLRSEIPETKKRALQLTETLKSAQSLLKPFAASILQQHKRDLPIEIGKALTAFDESNPVTLMGPAMMTGNLLKSEIAYQIDGRRVQRDLLEYILINFNADYLSAADAAGAITPPAKTVLKKFVAGDDVPQITGVTDLQVQDMNLDGYDDVVVTREGRLEVYSRPGGTGPWTLLLKNPETGQPLTSFILADIDRDYDRTISEIKAPLILRDADGDVRTPTDPVGESRWFDADLDVIAWGADGVVIFRNEVSDSGERSLVEIPQAESVRDIHDIVAVDLEADGDLDLAFATQDGITLWQNLDRTNFKNANDAAALPEHDIQALVAVDWDRNVAMDLVGVAGDGRAGVLENILHGRFRWVPFSRSVTLANGAQQISGLNVVGPNSHGEFDLWCSGGGAQPQQLSADASAKPAVPASAIRRIFADFDNNGSVEPFHFGGAEMPVSFPIEGVELPELPIHAVDGTATDIDDDGDLDIVYLDASGSLGLMVNEGGNSNNWMDVVARGKPDDPQFPSNRVNAHSIGATIEIREGSLYHGQVIASPKVHLGLGQAKSVDTIRVIWTDGIPQHVTDVRLLNAKLGILAPQILSGSCPYIYTWTGDRYEFFSDCLWAAPLGLVQANGELAPTREWENLLIPGSALTAKDGRYSLQLTEELHETAYFDRVQLLAVDHPADVAIFTNEKVGSPEMARHQIYTVKQPRVPKSITDGCGRDLLPGLKNIDGDYVQAFRGRVMQGLTDEWTMEFDLGDLAAESPEQVRLFLTGWVFPTDTSLNEGIHQDAGTAPPAPPSLEVPDGQGGWKVVRPFIGFPSGKTKAMVVDISDIFEGTGFRFRLKSSMELYWDQAFFTVNEDDAETRALPCEFVTADLHYRGFSRRTYADNALFRNGRAPEGYDYQSVTTDPRWPAISGRFTRYGDASPLLTDHDDRMVVMGPGDELTVEFSEPESPVPAGWVRDFVLTNIGFDKDANLNTISGQSSEPFPFRAMTRYPFAADGQVPSSPDYQRYIHDWQTREYSPEPFVNALQTDR